MFLNNFLKIFRHLFDVCFAWLFGGQRKFIFEHVFVVQVVGHAAVGGDEEGNKTANSNCFLDATGKHKSR